MRLRAVLALAVAGFGMFLMPIAAAQAAAYPPTICPSLSVSTTHPLPGEQIVVSGSDFSPNASVRLELHTKVYVLATVTTDSTGAFSTTVKLPVGVTGRHTLVAATGAPHTADCPGNPVVVLHIQHHGVGGSSASNGGHHGGTSFTGLDVLLILIAAAVLLAAGYGLNHTGKRRHAG